MGQLTTHLLDLSKGKPAANVRIDLYKAERASVSFLQSSMTNSDGRLDKPLLDGIDLHKGVYELHVHIGDYFKQMDTTSSSAFLDVITVRFTVSNSAENYHVPLLVSPYGYQVYRGS